MPNPELCTEADVTLLVHSFYDKVREDATLGPIFAAHVKNWDHHLATMVDFWSSALRGTARYRGAPLPKHAALPGLHIELFHQWLSLFRQTTQSLGNAGLQARADKLAHRIAGSLWYGYLQRHAAERPLVDIADFRMRATRFARCVPIAPQRPTAHVAKRVELEPFVRDSRKSGNAFS